MLNPLFLYEDIWQLKIGRNDEDNNQNGKDDFLHKFKRFKMLNLL